MVAYMSNVLCFLTLMKFVVRLCLVRSSVPQVQTKVENNQATLKVKIRDALQVNIYLLSFNSNKATLLGIYNPNRTFKSGTEPP